jgi:hypothetical protein
MSASGTEMNKYSDTVRGDSFYGYTDGLHTVQVIYNEYIGRFRIQGTLSLEPEESHWFDIIPEKTSGKAFNTAGFIQFNADKPASGSEAYTFQGNFTHLRTFMDRTHMGDGETHDPSYGQVMGVILSS